MLNITIETKRAIVLSHLEERNITIETKRAIVLSHLEERIDRG